MNGSGDEHVLTIDRRIEIHQENIKNYRFTRMLALVCIILSIIGFVAQTFLLVQGQNFIWGGVYSRVAIIALNLIAIAFFSYTMYNNSRLIRMNQSSIDYLENKQQEDG